MNLLDYIKGNRKGKGARKLELDAMQDPFLADAMEGFDSVKGDHADKISRMQAQIAARTASSSSADKRFVGYRIAVAAVVLIAALSGYLTLMNHKSTMLSAQENQQDTFYIYAPEEYLAKKRAELTQLQEESKGKASLNPIVKVENLNEIIQPFEPMYVYYPESHYDRDRYDMNSSEQLLAVAATPSVQSDYILPESISHTETARSEVAESRNVIQGRVTDQNGEPLIGVSIAIKGTNTGTLTDIDGNYSLKSNIESPELVASYIGFDSAEVSNPFANQDITMKESQLALNEVVVTGHGALKKKELTGAISTVEAKDLALANTSEVNKALEGKMAGVQAKSNDDAKIRIRGAGSISTDEKPLYVLDGVPVSDISHISPSDIESMEVLKDAASTAIYGSRASNGIVLITTKKASNSKPEPYTGWKSYNKYLNDNKTRTKGSDCEKKKGTVELEFEVGEDGKPINIRVAKSVCDSLDNDAISLLRNGALWNGKGMAKIKVKY
ncbi:energy transducer TonB [Dysgonomonas sp. 520]|uniref:energy transducer TonB family protein n=1 Tax=Dysgonomonas sp. 520 TaxID=2302931 RepID=UPI0013D16738|nr:energy transducer TonB [Dysgonomonas sp. 520]NDW11110.1 hypothetical protein [Dysgonomonas sp. 520]